MVLAAKIAPTHFNSPVKKLLGDRTGLPKLILHASVNTFIHTGDRNDYRGLNCFQIFGKQQYRAVVGNDAASGQGEVVSGRAFECMR